MVKNIITIVLVAVTAAKNAIWTFYTCSETLLSELLIDRLELRVGQNLKSLADQLELLLVHLHLLRVFHRMHL